MKLNLSTVLLRLVILAIIFCKFSNVSFAQQVNKTSTEKLLKLSENLKIEDYAELQKLLESEADVNSLNSKGESPLYVAFYMLDKTIKDSIAYNQPSRTSDVNAEIASLKYLLGKNGEITINGVKVTKEDAQKLLDKLNAPNIAPSKCRKIIELMIHNGADIDYPNKDGLTILQSAVIKKDFELSKLILTNGANPNLLDKDGVSLLQKTIENNEYRLCSLLLTNGADIGIVNDKIQLAYVSKELKSILEEYGATFKMKKVK